MPPSFASRWSPARRPRHDHAQRRPSSSGTSPLTGRCRRVARASRLRRSRSRRRNRPRARPRPGAPIGGRRGVRDLKVIFVAVPSENRWVPTEVRAVTTDRSPDEREVHRVRSPPEHNRRRPLRLRSPRAHGPLSRAPETAWRLRVRALIPGRPRPTRTSRRSGGSTRTSWCRSSAISSKPGAAEIFRHLGNDDLEGELAPLEQVAIAVRTPSMDAWVLPHHGWTAGLASGRRSRRSR
jgi:hypothetical protein